MGPGAEAVVLDYNWQRYQRVVDIGGAYGSFLARILRRNTKASGVLFDQPQVTSSTRLFECAYVQRSACELSATPCPGAVVLAHRACEGLLHLESWKLVYCHSTAASK